MPAKQVLTTNGNAYQKSKNRNYYTVKHYKTNPCTGRPERALCTKNIKGRLIERSEFAPYIEQNRQNIEANPKIYKQLQSIVALWNYKTAMGILLYHYKKRNEEGIFRCRINDDCLQPEQAYEHY